MTPPVVTPILSPPALDPNRPEIIVVGPAGMVGEELLSIVAERWPDRVGDLRLAGSARTIGQTRTVAGRPIVIEPVDEPLFERAQFAFFCATTEVAQTWAPIAAEAGAAVIDHSSAFRRDRDIPLVVPEANGAVLDEWSGPGVIANPNCTAILAATVLAPIHRTAGLREVTICTYQAASGGGRAMYEELLGQAADHAAGRAYRQEVVGRPYLFNLFSHDSPIGPSGFNGEEEKVQYELGRMLGPKPPRISATCVRVPIPRAHAEAIHIRLEQAISPEEVTRLLTQAPGVVVIDDRERGQFPEPSLAAGQDGVLVGRIRQDTFEDDGRSLALFLAGDQLRKGAALNAVQIAEHLVQTGRGSQAYTSRSVAGASAARLGRKTDL